ncbi:MAG: DUF1761 domain-containing protein [Acidobacteriota bacterium]|nr:DUF1761 domain-containing protein [Acidobacteriota bacterium]
MEHINIWAVLVAAVSSFMLGGLWYSPVMFLKPWSKANGFDEMKQDGHPAKVFGISFVLCLISAWVFAWWLGPNPELTVALQRGLIAGACFVAASFGVNYQFCNKPMTLWVIDGGYHTVQFTIFGLVLGLWP